MVNNLMPWVGGKYRLKKQILKYFIEDVKQYVEPFVGGGSVFLMAYSTFKECNDFILSDNNANLINAYCQIRDNLSEVIKTIQLLEHERYYEIRKQFNSSFNECSPQQAGTMLWLMGSCFGGVWCLNKKGEFNTAKARKFKNKIKYFKRLQELSTILQDPRIKILHQDFHVTLNNIDIKPNSFFFFDPPYIKGGGFLGFGIQHHELLLDWCKYLNEMGAYWLMSNAGDEIETMYIDFIIDKKWVQRTCGYSIISKNFTKEYWIRNR